MEWIPIVDSGRIVTDNGEILDMQTMGKIVAVEFANAGNTTVNIIYGGMTRPVVPGSVFEIDTKIPYTYLASSYTFQFMPIPAGTAINKVLVSFQKVLE